MSIRGIICLIGFVVTLIITATVVLGYFVITISPTLLKALCLAGVASASIDIVLARQQIRAHNRRP